MEQNVKLNRVLAIMLVIAIMFTSMGMHYALSNTGGNYSSKNAKEYITSPTQIQDENFRKSICETLGLGDRSSTGWVLTNEELPLIQGLETLIIPTENVVKSLAGVELFTGLKTLKVLNNKLENVDVSKNLLLEDLHLGENNIKNLDISNNVKLKNLKVYANNLSSIDISKNIDLVELNVAKNSISDLDTSKNKSLKILSAHDNKLQKVNIGSINTLTEIRLFNNNLPYFNVGSNNPTVLSCDNQNVFGELYQDNGLYNFDMRNVVGTVNLGNVEIVSTDNGIKFNPSTGIISFTSKPKEFTYQYNMHKNSLNGSTYLKNLKVDFSGNQYKVTYDATKEGTVSPTSEVVSKGETPKLINDAVPNDNKKIFTGWQQYEKVDKIWTSGNYSSSIQLVLTKSNRLYYSGPGIAPSSVYNNYVEVDLTSAGIKSPIKNVYVFSKSMFIVTEDNNLYAWGDNLQYGLGLPQAKKYTEFTKVNTSMLDSEIIDIKSSDSATIIQTKNKIYGVGNNNAGSFGQTSNGGYVQTITEIVQSSTSPIKKIFSVGYGSTFLLNENGELYVSGNNSNGDLGLGHTGRVKDFTKLDTISGKIKDVLSVKNLSNRTFILTEDNKYYFLGDDQSDLFGFKSLGSLLTPTDVTQKLQDLFAGNFTLSDIKDIQYEHDGLMVLTKNNDLYVKGYNDSGRFGLGSNSGTYPITKIDLKSANINKDNIKAVNLNSRSSAILLNSGELYTSGEKPNTGNGYYSNVFVENRVKVGNVKTTKQVRENVIIDAPYGFEAKYETKKNVTVTYDATNVGYYGSNTNTQTLNESVFQGNKPTNVQQPNLKQNINKIFLGYQNDDGVFLTLDEVKNTTITKSTKYTAVYKNIVKYNVTYDPTNFGIVDPTSEKVLAGEKPTLTNDAVPNQPEDYRFIGWKEKNKIKQVGLGYLHSVILTESGEVYITGSNSYGQLGLGDTQDRNVFTKVNLTFKVKELVVGIYNTAIISEDDKIYATGLNNNGQLGLGNTALVNKFIEVKLPEGVKFKKVVYARNHTAILTENNELYMVGYNAEGQLGLGDNVNRLNFTKIDLPDGIKIKDFALGRNHTGILTETGEVYTTGLNNYGQLGLGDNNDRKTFTKVNLSNDISVKELVFSMHGYFSGILTETGEIYTTGLNNNGQLGLGDSINKNIFTKVNLADDVKVKNLYMGNTFTGIMSEDNKVYLAGSNQYGQLVQGNYGGKLEQFTYISNVPNNVNKLIIGGEFTAVLTSDNVLYMCGKNSNGQLGLGDVDNRNIFNKIDIDINYEFGDVITTAQVKDKYITSDTIFVAQYEKFPEYTVTYDPTALGTVNPTSEVVKDGKNPMLTNDAVPNQPEDYRFTGWKESLKIKEIINGYDSAALLLQNGEVWVTGNNSAGQLGLGDNNDRNAFTKLNLLELGITSPVKQFILGGSKSVMLLENGEVWVTGINDSGQLGIPSIAKTSKFLKVDLASAGINSPVKSVGAMGRKTGLLLENNEVWMTGAGSGLGFIGNTNKFTKVDLAEVGITTPIKQLIVGDSMSAILLENNELWVTGSNSYGSLGLGDKVSRDKFTKVDLTGAGITTPIKQVVTGNQSFALILENGEVYSCGGNSIGQLGLGDNRERTVFTKLNLPSSATSPVKQVSLGNLSTSILLENGEVWVTGYNNCGQLGLGDKNDRTVFTKIDLASAGINNSVSKISRGSFYMYLILENNEVYSVGDNSYGQLGFGNTTNTSTLKKADFLALGNLLTSEQVKQQSIVNNATFVAQYENLYRIEFNNGIVPDDQIIGQLPDSYTRLVDGTTVTLTPPPNYKRPDYKLIGWTTNRDSQLVVEIPLDGTVTINGANVILYPVFEKDTSTSISVSMPIKLTFGNYSDKATETSDYAISQDGNRFHSALYSIKNNSTFVGIGDGSINVSIAGMEQIGSGAMTLVPETSGLNKNTIYDYNQMRVGLTLDGVAQPFVGTQISPEIQAKGEVGHGLTKPRTAMFSSMLNPDITNKQLFLGRLPSAQANNIAPIVPTVGQFKIVGDASNKFPKNNIQQDYKITFRFERLPD